MGAQPGTPAAAVPFGEDYVQRMLENTARDTKEQISSAVQAQAVVNQDLADQVAAIAAQQAYLASLISRDAATATFNTGTLTNDSTWHLVGSQMVITSMPIATGKVRITVSAAEASISPGTNSVNAGITYAIDGVNTLDMTARSARNYSYQAAVSSPLMRIDIVTLTPGTYTIRAQAGYWSNGSGTASVNFASLRLIAEVIGSD